MKIRNTLGILSTEVPIGNLLWVDAVNGVDAAAVRGRMTIPFRTLAAAKNAAVSGDTIVVLPGLHTTSEQLAKAGVNWHFMNGATTTSSMTGNSLFVVNSAMNFRVTGAGYFNVGGGGLHILEVTNSSADVFFQGEKIHGTKSAIKMTAGASVVVAADWINGDESSAIEASGGTLAVRARRIESTSLHGVHCSGATMDIDAFQIKSTSAKGIYFTGGTARIRAVEVLALAAPAVEFTYAGWLTIQNARLVSQWNNTAGRAVSVSGGSSGIRLQSCVLICHSNAADSIGGAASTFTVQFHGICTANKAKGANVSGPTLSTSPAGFNVGAVGTVT